METVTYDTLATDYLVSLENLGHGWKITYWSKGNHRDGGEQDSIYSKSFDTLISDWELRLSELELQACLKE